MLELYALSTCSAFLDLTWNVYVSAGVRLVNWKVVVMNEKNGKREFFHGRAHDISMGGLCLYSETNLTFTNSVIVLISVPPDSAKQKPHVPAPRYPTRIDNTTVMILEGNRKNGDLQ